MRLGILPIKAQPSALYPVSHVALHRGMIERFRHKGLGEAFWDGVSAKVGRAHVNGPWCITFEFNDGDAFRVDLDQYH